MWEIGKFLKRIGTTKKLAINQKVTIEAFGIHNVERVGEFNSKVIRKSVCVWEYGGMSNVFDKSMDGRSRVTKKQELLSETKDRKLWRASWNDMRHNRFAFPDKNKNKSA